MLDSRTCFACHLCQDSPLQISHQFAQRQHSTNPALNKASACHVSAPALAGLGARGDEVLAVPKRIKRRGTAGDTSLLRGNYINPGELLRKIQEL